MISCLFWKTSLRWTILFDSAHIDNNAISWSTSVVQSTPYLNLTMNCQIIQVDQQMNIQALAPGTHKQINILWRVGDGNFRKELVEHKHLKSLNYSSPKIPFTTLILPWWIFCRIFNTRFFVCAFSDSCKQSTEKFYR